MVAPELQPAGYERRRCAVAKRVHERRRRTDVGPISQAQRRRAHRHERWCVAPAHQRGGMPNRIPRDEGELNVTEDLHDKPETDAAPGQSTPSRWGMSRRKPSRKKPAAEVPANPIAATPARTKRGVLTAASSSKVGRRGKPG